MEQRYEGLDELNEKAILAGSCYQAAKTRRLSKLTLMQSPPRDQI
ncbi:hypothetical protein O9993_10575 [Vibrio lentus]|nr:hypothetical protein [Vibrio lentus]